MVKRASHREWRRADDDTDSFPVPTDEPVLEGDGSVEDDDAVTTSSDATARTTKRKVPAWVKRLGEAVVARLGQISAVIAGGLLLCLSFPPFGWWYAAIIAFALLAWALTRETTRLVGGFGYGFLFGAGLLPPAVAVDGCHGRPAALAGPVAPAGGVCRHCSACAPSPSAG